MERQRSLAFSHGTFHRKRMPSNEHIRLNGSMVDPQELERLAIAFERSSKISLIDHHDARTELPKAFHQILLRMIQLVREGRAAVLLPEDETFTTQQAADFLGISRQYFVNILERGEVPFHQVGANRRVYFKDLIEFKQRRAVGETKS